MAKFPKLVRLVTDPPLGPSEGPFYQAFVEAAPKGKVPTPMADSAIGLEKMILGRMASSMGLSYEQISREMLTPMALMTPKMRRLLRSADWRKRKRGARLYWAAPGEHSVWAVRNEINQGNFDRSKILIREGFRRLADSTTRFSAALDKSRSTLDRLNMKLTVAAQRSGKTAFVEREIERLRAADPNAKIVVFEPRKEKP